MANIVITKSGNSMIVDFGVYSSEIGATKKSYDIRDITEVELGSDFVEVAMRDSHGGRFLLLTYDSTYSGSERFIVDSVETVAPTSESDLFDKITALR